jgi:hypothetical protein
MTLPRVVSRGLARAAFVASGALALIAHLGSAQQPARQPSTLTGTVTSAEGTPLGQATVLVQDLNLGATTRSDGTYSIAIPGARVPAAPVTVTARAVGFKPTTVQVALRAGSNAQNFSLAENPLRLGEIVVTGAATVS